MERPLRAESEPTGVATEGPEFPPIGEVPVRMPTRLPRRNRDARCRCKPSPEWLPADTPFQRLEKSPCGVAEEEFAFANIA